MSIVNQNTDEKALFLAYKEELQALQGVSSIKKAILSPEPYLQLRSLQKTAYFSPDNQLLLLEGGETLCHAARLARRHGANFPLARPFPIIRMAEIAVHWPIFVECFFSEISGFCPNHGRSETPKAPRSAQGPDPFSILLAGSLWAEKIHLRAFAKEKSQWRSAKIPLQKAVTLLLALQEESRALVVDAQLIPSSLKEEEPQVQIFILHATGSSSLADSFKKIEVPFYKFAKKKSLLPRSARLESSRSATLILKNLQAQERLLAAPFMHRLGWLSSQLSTQRMRLPQKMASLLVEELNFITTTTSPAKRDSNDS